MTTNKNHSKTRTLAIIIAAAVLTALFFFGVGTAITWTVDKVVSMTNTSLRGQPISLELVQSWCRPAGSPACDIRNFRHLDKEGTNVTYANMQDNRMASFEVPAGVLYRMSAPVKGYIYYNAGPGRTPDGTVFGFSTREGYTDFGDRGVSP